MPKQASQTSYDAVLKAPFAWVAIRCSDSAVTAVDFLDHKPAISGANRLAELAAKQISAYLEDPAVKLDVPVAPRGSHYQQQVWKELRKLKSGETDTYGSLARRIGSGARAVGGACRRNPVPILIPCHRVVSASGLGGFMGATTGQWHDIKGWLLGHEARKDDSRYA